MIKGKLKPFSLVPEGVLSVAYTLSRDKERVCISYGLRGFISELVLPEQKPAETVKRRDELWRHSCFELFIKEVSQESERYLECNFSPSGDWNVYELSGYRQGIRELEGVRRPTIESRHAEHSFSLDVDLDCRGFMSHSQQLNVGVSCVIEDVKGNLSYWALSHPGQRPDFHDVRSFEVRL